MAVALCGAAQAQDVFVTPRAVVYPRQLIRADMIELRETDMRRIGSGASLTTLADVVGKMSRVTLLPGRPIPPEAIGEPQIVQIGGNVELRFSAAGVDIRAVGVALQAAAAGERIRVRNTQTAIVVTGTLGADGAVTVEDRP